MTAAADQDVNEICSILRTHRSLRTAAAMLAIVRARIHILAGADTEAKARAMMQQDDTAALEAWSVLTGTALAS